MDDHQTLAPETQLDQYRIVSVLGQGGFGKTYLAKDTNPVRLVAIKEFFPRDVAMRDGNRVRPIGDPSRFADGRDRFQKEAQTLARLSHGNIVRVFRAFEANETSYIVLEYVEGRDLDDWLKALGRRPDQSELDKLVKPLLEALELVHESGILHRDVTPKNIRIRNSDNSPVLLDFGTAKALTTMGANQQSTMAVFVPGFSPIEVYSTAAKNQGPWTDVYGLSATLYRALSGEPPPEAPDRANQESLVTASSLPLKPGAYRPTFLAGIDWGLEVRPENRPQTIAELRGPLLEGRPVTVRGGKTQPPLPKTAPAKTKPGKTAPAKTAPPRTGPPGGDVGRTTPIPTSKRPGGLPVLPIAVVGGILVLGGGGYAAWQNKLFDFSKQWEEAARQKAEAEARKKADDAQKQADAAAAAAKQAEAEAEEARKKQAAAAADAARKAQENADAAARAKAEEDAKKAAEETRKKEAEAAAAEEERKRTEAAANKRKEDARKLARSNWQEIVKSKGDGATVSTMAASLDGRILATATDKGSVQLWDLADGGAKENGPTIDAKGPIKALAIGSNGADAAVAVASALPQGRTISFWNQRKKTDETSAKENRLVLALAFNATSRQFVAVSVIRPSEGKFVTQREFFEPGGSLKESLKLDRSDGIGADEPTTAAVIAHRDETVAVARGSSVEIYKPREKKPSLPPIRWTNGSKTVLALVFSDDDSRLAIGGAFGEVEIHDVRGGTRKTLQVPKDPNGAAVEIRALAFSAEGSGALLAAATTSGKVYVWNTASADGEPPRIMPDAAADASWLSFLPAQQGQDNTLIMPWSDGTVRQISIAAGS